MQSLRKQTIAFLLVAITLSGISQVTAAANVTLKKFYDKLSTDYVQSPQRGLDVVDSLEQKGILTQGMANIERCIFYAAMDKKQLAVDCGEKAFKDKSIFSSNDSLMVAFQADLYSALGKAHLDLRHKEKAMKYAILGLELAKKSMNKQELASQYLNVACAYYETGDKINSMKNFSLAEKTLEKEKDAPFKVTLSYIYGMEVNYLIRDNSNYQEALEACKKREAIISQLEALPSLNQANLAQIDRQKGYLYPKMAYVLIKLGDRVKAKKYRDLFYTTEFSKDPINEIDICSYMLEAGEYDNVIRIQKRTMDMCENDTVNVIYLMSLDKLAKAYSLKGDFKEAYAYRNRQITLNDSLIDRDNAGIANEIGQIYESSQKDIRINEQNSRIWILSLSLLALIVLLVLIAIHLRRINAKNRQLFQDILQLNKLKKEQEEMEDKDNSKELAETPTDNQSENAMKQLAFQKLINRVRKEKLFTSPDFGRKELCRMAATNENYLYQMFSECMNDTVANVLNNMKLDYATQLMADSASDKSIEQVALESGFNSVRTFQRLFKNRFGLTPSSFLKQKQKEKKQES